MLDSHPKPAKCYFLHDDRVDSPNMWNKSEKIFKPKQGVQIVGDLKKVNSKQAHTQPYTSLQVTQFKSVYKKPKMSKHFQVSTCLQIKAVPKWGHIPYLVAKYSY